VQQPEDDENFNGVWARIVGMGGRREGSDDGIYGGHGPRFNYDFYAFQAGVDVYRLEHDDGVRDHAGLYGAIGRAEAKVRNWDGQTAGNDMVEAWSVGAYWTRFDDKRAYLDGVVQYTWYDLDAQSTRLPALKGHARGFAASLEGGKPYDWKNDWKIEPQAQFIYQHFFGASGSDSGGRVRFEDGDSLVGRVGARLHRTWADENEKGEQRLRSGWVRLNLWHEFLDQPKLSFATADGDVSFTSDTGENWLELNGGSTLQMNEHGFLYFNASYSWDLDGRGHAYTGKLGVRFNW